MKVALTRWSAQLARADFRWTLVGAIRSLTSGGIFLGGLLIALSQYPPVAKTAMLDMVFWGGLGCSVLSTLANKAARWVQEFGQATIDSDQSSMLSAGLRAIRGVLFDSSDLHPSKLQQHLLQMIADQITKICPAPRARVHASLIIQSGQILMTREFSKFRDNRAPELSGSIDDVGIGKAFREKRLTYISGLGGESGDCSCYAISGTRSLLAFPLVDDDECIGIVAIDSNVTDHFSGKLEELERWIGPYIELIHILERVQRQSRTSGGLNHGQ